MTDVMYDVCIWCNSTNEPWHFEISELGINELKNILNNMSEDLVIKITYNNALYYFLYKNITCIRIEDKGVE